MSESRIATRLAEKGITLPEPATPAGAYVLAVRTGNHIFTSGQIPVKDGEIPYLGKVGADLTLEQAQELAAICVDNAVAAVAQQLDGDLDRVVKVVKVVGFVAVEPSFTQIPQVINGASNRLAEIFGDEIGAHARSAVGVAALPLNVPVEVEIVVEVRD